MASVAVVLALVLALVAIDAAVTRHLASLDSPRRSLLALYAVAAGLVSCFFALGLSEECSGDPRFACESAAGISGATLWALALVLLTSGISLGVASWRRVTGAVLLVGAWAVVVLSTSEAFAERHETLLLAFAVIVALGLGSLLRFWVFALIPLFSLIAVPFGTQGDSDGTSAWVWVAVDSVVVLSLPFLLSAAIATVLWVRRDRHARRLR